jgi:hypothetical protein
VLDGGDVVCGVTGHGDQIGEEAGGDAAEAVLLAEDL